MNSKAILVVACPRSGTGYASRVFRAIGYDVKHESWGKDGISSYYYADDMFIKKIEKCLRGRELVVFHQVRHPLKMISSYKARLKNIRDVVPDIPASDSDLQKAAKFWYYWNKKIEDRDWNIAMRYQVEKMTKNLRRIVSFVGEYKPSMLEQAKSVPTDVNTSKVSQPIRRKEYCHVHSWKEIRSSLGNNWTDLLMAMAERYGYGIR